MKLEFSKRKTNTSVMKRVCRVLFVIVAIFITPLSVYADNNNTSYTFQSDNQPMTTDVSGTTLISYSNSTFKCQNVGNVDIYFAGYYVDTYIHVILLASESGASFKQLNNNYVGSINNYNSDLEVYYRDILNFSDSSIVPFMPIYDDLEDVLQAYSDFLDNPYPEPTNSNTINYSLPAGNIAYIEFNNSFDSFTLQCTMPTMSYAIGSSPWPESNQYYGFASSLPSGSFTPPTTKIDWTRNGRTSLAGVTNNAVFEYGPHHPTSGNYLVIYNPAYYGGTNNGPYEFMNNGAINIQASNVVSIKVYQLDSQLTQINPAGNLDIETSLTGVDYDGEFDEETGDIVWVNGEQPIDGGGNLPTSSESGFQSFLSNLVQKIVNVFAPAQQAIQTLANAVSNFGTWMYSLYIWLPAPVLNLLTSAITLAIIIGVIKVFL